MLDIKVAKRLCLKWWQILCLHGSPDGPGQYVWSEQPTIFSSSGSPLKLFFLGRYVAVMNAIFSAQRSMVCRGLVILFFNFVAVSFPSRLIRKSQHYLHKGNLYNLGNGTQIVILWFYSKKCILLQVPIDSCVIGSQHSAFLQQVSFLYLQFLALNLFFPSSGSFLAHWCSGAYLWTGLLHHWWCIFETPSIRWTVSISLGKCCWIC